MRITLLRPGMGRHAIKSAQSTMATSGSQAPLCAVPLIEKSGERLPEVRCREVVVPLEVDSR
jgi:hypothetical protein